ncbi:hypothetical protein JG688_00012777 [Phytophthora aleatoria]|uniref:Uncharacterized protein n=1 Tax=Phytophthora aleatoria TaxID=2496075 RepID=A0A8J5IY39_9STRA|nr:hypothetical protein JG688_00012777 [Phytophthora aleatoria]
MPAQVDSPPVLECAYEHIDDSKRHWKAASMIYHGVLITVIVVALVILAVVQTEIVDVGDSDDKDDWVEVSSQIINGVFTWLAITNQSFYIYRFVMTTIVLKASAGHQNEGIESVFVSKSATCATCEINASRAEAQERGEIQNSLAENEIEEIGDFIFLRDDVKYLRNTLSILNCGSLFQYVLSGYMWSYDESSRPGFAIPVLLPPAILCNVVGQYRFYQLRKKSKDRQIISARDAPIPDELSSTRNSLVSQTTQRRCSRSQ